MAASWAVSQYAVRGAVADAAFAAAATAASVGAVTAAAVARSATAAAPVVVDAAIAIIAALDAEIVYAKSAATAAIAADAAARADGLIIDHGASALALAGRPLWLVDVPAWARDDWQRLEKALLEENQDWRVWTDWYRDRHEGTRANDALEVARVTIAEAIWKQGPRAVNGEIMRLIKLHRPLKPLANVPSAIGFEWTAAGTITITSSSANWPVFPLPASEKDHRDRLDTCRTLAGDIASALKAQKYQVRGSYADELAKYRKRLPKEPGTGNILLADAAARVLRDLFAAEAIELPDEFAAQLKVFLEHHVGLRVFYPELRKFYRDVQTGRIETPLPQDAVNGLINGVRLSHKVFDRSVGDAIAESMQPPPAVAPPHPAESSRANPNQPMPPADPLKELDPKKAHDFTVGGIVNALWKTYLEGEKVPKAGEGWHKAGETLQPFVRQILEWLHDFMGS